MRGYDVYLFLAGMMLISELARKTGLFDHVAALAVRQAQQALERKHVSKGAQWRPPGKKR